jgi:hypothetical protein
LPSIERSLALRAAPRNHAGVPRARFVVPMLAAIAVADGAMAAGSVGGERAPDSGVRDVVLPRFSCPVILESDRRCGEQPRSASIVVRRAGDGRCVGKITTDARGRFHRALEPGTYAFALQRPHAARAVERVVVPPHRVVPVLLR